MLILDFSSQSISELLKTPTNAIWQHSIMEFLEEFHTQNQLIVKSSGSTGIPKKFTFSKELFLKSAEMTAEFLKLKKGNSALLCLPIQYIAGKMMLVRAYTLGLKLYCIEPKLHINSDENYDFAAMTPLQAEHSQLFLPKVQKLILGGMPIGVELHEKLCAFPTEIYETFGMTETLSHIALKRISREITAFETLTNCTISINDKQCLVIDSPFSENPLQTNDVVECIDSKHFIWKGRYDNVINSGGIKLFPEEIEKNLLPFVTKPFYISSQKHTTLGQEVVLVIESSEAIDWNLHNIIPKNVLSKFEFPKKLIVQKEFNRTQSGKIIREKF